MKKIISLLSLIVLSVSFSFANEPFQYDEQEINNEFKQLNKVEQYVKANENITLDKLQKQNSDLLTDLNLVADSSSSLAAEDLPLGIPAFWWGCVLTLVGVILVYVLTDKDSAQTKKALYGCLVTAGAYIIFYVVLYGAVLGNASGFF
jgi:hypothetical protein